ncbi:MAG TPA: hypothetical protein VMV69_05685 [Pirellulales bacterium]|nr:hypothetical protein [Pirellulales bacterium]
MAHAHTSARMRAAIPPSTESAAAVPATAMATAATTTAATVLTVDTNGHRDDDRNEAGYEKRLHP